MSVSITGLYRSSIKFDDVGVFDIEEANPSNNIQLPVVYNSMQFNHDSKRILDVGYGVVFNNCTLNNYVNIYVNPADKKASNMFINSLIYTIGYGIGTNVYIDKNVTNMSGLFRNTNFYGNAEPTIHFNQNINDGKHYDLSFMFAGAKSIVNGQFSNAFINNISFLTSDLSPNVDTHGIISRTNFNAYHISWPEGVTDLSSYFEYCYGYTPRGNVVIPASVTNMHNFMLSWRPGVEGTAVNVEFLGNNVIDASEAFSYVASNVSSITMSLPDSIENAANMFFQCGALQSITSLPSSLRNAVRMFSYTAKFQTIASGVINLKQCENIAYMFNNCPAFNLNRKFGLGPMTVILPEGNPFCNMAYTFRGVNGELNFPNDVNIYTNNMEGAFGCVHGLHFGGNINIYIPSNGTSYLYTGFTGTVQNISAFKNITITYDPNYSFNSQLSTVSFGQLLSLGSYSNININVINIYVPNSNLHFCQNFVSTSTNGAKINSINVTCKGFVNAASGLTVDAYYTNNDVGNKVYINGYNIHVNGGYVCGSIGFMYGFKMYGGHVTSKINYFLENNARPSTYGTGWISSCENNYQKRVHTCGNRAVYNDIRNSILINGVSTSLTWSGNTNSMYNVVVDAFYS